MGKKTALILLALVALASAYEGDTEERWPEGGGGRGRREGEGEEEQQFLLQDSKEVIRTDAGSMKVVRGYGTSKLYKPPMHIGFITMEPKSLFIPQYLDSSLILFVRRGEAKVGHIYKDELVERDLKMGDILRIGAGSAFYLVNTAQGQRLHVICSIDTSQTLGWNTFQSFFIGGGKYPTSVLSGFDRLTLATAFNVSQADVGEMLTKQANGPIVYLSDTSGDKRSPSLWSKFMDMEHNKKMGYMRRIVRIRDNLEQEPEQEQSQWSFSKSLISFFGRKGDRKGKGKGKGPDAYNIYDRKPDFSNDYGWSIALDDSDYSPLKHDDVGVYLVNLTAGSMMAPHINPSAHEYGIVLRGVGTVQIVNPNGTLAMNAKVKEGDVFWVPRYFPFCQIASRMGPFEFFGFTTSAHDNKPQFLAGANSLLQNMISPEFAAAFGLSEERLRAILEAQRESTILPSASVAPPEEGAPEERRVW